jgi:hypothetical protein
MTKIRNGHYEMMLGTIVGSTTASIELRDGQFSGQTRLGTVIAGKYEYSPARGVYHYDCTVDIGPSGFTFLGIPFGDVRRRLVSRGEATATDGDIRFSTSIVGRAVDIAMRYVGPLGHASGAQ